MGDCSKPVVCETGRHVEARTQTLTCLFRVKYRVCPTGAAFDHNPAPAVCTDVRKHASAHVAAPRANYYFIVRRRPAVVVVSGSYRTKANKADGTNKASPSKRLHEIDLLVLTP